MKKSELRRLVAEYKEIKSKSKRTKSIKLKEKLAQIEHRYYHETGRILNSDLKEST